MKYQGSQISVNCCRKCRRNLRLTADKLGYDICADCLDRELKEKYGK